MTEYPEIIEEFAEQIIESTEQRDDLDANITTFCESLEQQIRDKVQALATNRFCPDCSAKMRTVMDVFGGKNLEEITVCSNPDCLSH
jgi:sirohydrochlorin ferrochelatase